MIINLNWLQLHAGISTPILESREILDYTPESWFLEIRRFLMKSNTTLVINKLWQPKILRKNDEMILQQIMGYTDNKKARQIINNWRIYFQVNSISEITNITGDKIQKKFWQKNEVKRYRSNSKLRWPLQNHPNLCNYKFWTNYITNITDSDK
jgi:hypothetical protein